MRKPDTVM